MRINSLISVALFVMLACLTVTATAETYRWEDSKGVVHFTDDREKIPSKYRKKALERAGQEYGQQAPATEAARKPAPPPGPVDGAVSDTVAPNRDIWQSRFQSLRSEKTMLENRLTAKRQELTDAQWRRRKFARPANRVETTALEEEIIQTETRVREIDKALADLEIEASKAAVPLEWRR